MAGSGLAGSVLADDGAADGTGLGSWLVEQACGASGWEAAWLAGLARFDQERGWAADGALSCADWLIGRVRLARSTAFDKLRVAHELARRPLVAAALAAGQISYCAVREITRAVGAEVEVDEALVDLARRATVLEVRRAVRAYLLLAEQDRRPAEGPRGRGLRMVCRGDGTTRLEAVLSDVEAAEVAAALDERMPEAIPDGPGDESTRVDGQVKLADWEFRPWQQRRADALMELVRERAGRRVGADRYLVHLVVSDSGCELLGGEPVDPAVAARIRCDCSTVTHWVSGVGEPLHVGRRRRRWSSGQRRAIAVRDRGRCRFPSCERTCADVHHVVPWEDGGGTDVSNGILLCPHHHTLLHEGWTITGDVNGTLVFHRPFGVGVAG